MHDHLPRSGPSSPGSHTEPRHLDHDEFASYVTAVTSAFGDPTRREIYLYAREPGVGVTAADVARHFALHPNVARHHLDKLAAGGYLDVDLARTESAGRPSKRYRSVAPLQTLDFTPRRDDLIAILLIRTIERLDPLEASKLAEEVGFEYGTALAARMSPLEGQHSVKSAMAAVADALTAHGFAAHTETVNDGLRIVSEACPFGASAQRFPHVMCAIDRGMVRGMLSGLYGDTQPLQSETRHSGADHCVTLV